MGTVKDKKFSELLDELMEAAEVVPDEAAVPGVSLDYLVVAEELHSGRISITPEEAEAEYRAMSETDPVSIEPAIEDIVVVGPLPSTDVEDIARELCVAGITVPHELDRVRRDFAFANHPDRVEPHLRNRAMIRMQVANQLIDQAKRQLARNSA